jgi:L-malate glycosyltransferase
MVKKKLKVLYVINGLGSGGTERQLAELLSHIDKSKIEPILFYYLKDDFFRSKIEAAGVKIYFYNKSAGDKFSINKLYKFIKSFLKIVKDENADIIHSWGVNANFWARIIRLFIHTKVIISIRNTKLDSKTSIWEKLLHKRFDMGKWYFFEKFLARYASAVVVNSPAIKDLYCEKYKIYEASKTFVVNNGFDFERIAHISKMDRAELRGQYHIGQDKFIIVTVGRVVEQKNQLCLLKAGCSLMARGHENFKIFIIGKKFEYSHKLEEYLMHSEVRDYVEFIDEKEDCMEYFKLADLSVLPSLWEGMPNVVIESMAAGTPVICSRIAGIGTLIEDNVNGYLFAVDDHDALADKIGNYIRLDEESRAKISQAAINKIKRDFSIMNMSTTLEEIYSRIVNEENG